MERAQRSAAGIALEDLTGIRSGLRPDANSGHDTPMGLFQLRQYVTYKAALAGVPVILVDPRHTRRSATAVTHRQSQSAYARSFLLPPLWLYDQRGL